MPVKKTYTYTYFTVMQSNALFFVGFVCLFFVADISYASVAVTPPNHHVAVQADQATPTNAKARGNQTTSQEEKEEVKLPKA